MRYLYVLGPGMSEQSIRDRAEMMLSVDEGLGIERRLPYEESVRGPLLVRYPPLVAAGSKVESLVSSVDIAPSILAFAQSAIPKHVQGQSFVPLPTGAAQSDLGKLVQQSISL